jgi:hypothetical protein
VDNRCATQVIGHQKTRISAGGMVVKKGKTWLPLNFWRGSPRRDNTSNMAAPSPHDAEPASTQTGVPRNDSCLKHHSLIDARCAGNILHGGFDREEVCCGRAAQSG